MGNRSVLITENGLETTVPNIVESAVRISVALLFSKSLNGDLGLHYLSKHRYIYALYTPHIDVLNLIKTKF